MMHVPFKGGGPATIALASGEIQAMTATIGSLIPHIAVEARAAGGRHLGQAGEAVSRTCRRSRRAACPATNSSPGSALSWLPGRRGRSWTVSTPSSGRRSTHPDVARILSAQTLDPMPMSPEEFARLLKADYDKYEKVIKLSGAKLD